MAKDSIQRILESEQVRSFMLEHERRETATRWACPECFFETGTADTKPNHAPGCSRAALAAAGGEQ